MNNFECTRVIRVIHAEDRDLEVLCSGTVVENVCRIRDMRGPRVLMEFRCVLCGDFSHTVLSGVAAKPFFEGE